MGRVFIVNKAGHDFSSAEKYGELVPVTTGNINIARPDRDLFNITQILNNFKEKDDYLLLSGNVMANAMCVAVLAFSQVSPLQLLVYDAKSMEYHNHNLYLDHVKKEVRFLRKKVDNCTESKVVCMYCDGTNIRKIPNFKGYYTCIECDRSFVYEDTTDK